MIIITAAGCCSSEHWEKGVARLAPVGVRLVSRVIVMSQQPAQTSAQPDRQQKPANVVPAIQPPPAYRQQQQDEQTQRSSLTTKQLEVEHREQAPEY